MSPEAMQTARGRLLPSGGYAVMLQVGLNGDPEAARQIQVMRRMWAKQYAEMKSTLNEGPLGTLRYAR
jgi:hypothetical protein